MARPKSKNRVIPLNIGVKQNVFDKVQKAQKLCPNLSRSKLLEDCIEAKCDEIIANENRSEEN